MSLVYKNLPPTEYDKVVVFDLLSDAERKKHDISGKLNTVFVTKKMPIVEVKYLTNKSDLEKELISLLGRAKNGEKFILQFVAHGNKDCIAFKHTGERISWKDLGARLTDINLAASETLILNMTSCLGLNGIKAVDFSPTQKPFFGLIGYSEKLKISAGIKANEILYGHIIDGKPINEAVRLLQTELSDDKFNCISAQGYAFLKTKKKKAS